jgi:GST-like protein
MSITLFHAKMSSAGPVAMALRELEVPHEKINVDLAAGEQRKPELLALNPNGKVPTLVVDGTPMFEALAINQWLGDRYGVAKGMWPAADSPARLEALSWTTWAYVTYGAAIQRLNAASSPRVPAEQHNAAAAAAARKELSDLLGVLEGRLAKRPYVLGETFTLADLIVASVVTYSTYCGVSVDAHPQVKAWLGRFAARPSFNEEWA